MRNIKRLFYYLLLNILVSAATVLLVLNMWNRSHPPQPGATPVVILVTSSPAALPVTSEASDLQGSSLQVTQEPAASLLPSATFELTAYKVKSGDTLGTIAQQFDLTIADLLAVNDIPDPDTLSIGQTIYIPPGPIPTATRTPKPSPTEEITPTLTPRPTHGPSPTPSPTASGLEAQVQIEAVISPGVLENERVVLARSGDGELSLLNWRLEDENGNVYIFPELTLYKGGAVNLHTIAGQNTVVDLYWGLTGPVWKSGETATLYDAQGNVRSTYPIP